MFIKSIVFLSFIATCLAALAFGPLPQKPEKYANLEGCYIEKLDVVIPFGESAPARGKCMEYRCKPKNIVYATCGVMVVGEGAHLEEDKTKPYPHCCPEMVKD